MGAIVTFDPEADALAVSFREVAAGEVARTQELDRYRLVDYDAAGEVLSVEFLAVSERGVPLDGVPRAEEIREALRAFPAFAA